MNTVHNQQSRLVLPCKHCTQQALGLWLPTPQPFIGDLPGNCFTVLASVPPSSTPLLIQEGPGGVHHRSPEGYCGTAALEGQLQECDDRDLFLQRLSSVFVTERTHKEAQHVLPLTQGSRSVAQYAVEFCTLAVCRSAALCFSPDLHPLCFDGLPVVVINFTLFLL